MPSGEKPSLGRADFSEFWKSLIMLRPRVIPCLLVHRGGLVKTIEFGSPKYIGDPINAVRIFNEKEADELMVLDIDATVQRREPDFSLIKRLAAECRMPICYGGGVTTVDHVVRLVNLGVEKVAISSAAVRTPDILGKMASAVGGQSIVVVIDVRRRTGFSGPRYDLCSHNGTIVHDLNPVDYAKMIQEFRVGEIVVNSIDRDGKMDGYDLELAEIFRTAVRVPLTFLGGAGSFNHMNKIVNLIGNVGCAAGSLFVFKGKYRAVLINYPTVGQRMEMFKNVK
jgi:cyclase